MTNSSTVIAFPKQQPAMAEQTEHRPRIDVYGLLGDNVKAGFVLEEDSDVIVFMNKETDQIEWILSRVGAK